MPTPNQIKQQINDIIAYLLEVGISDDQRYAFQRPLDGGMIDVTFEGAHHVSAALKGRAYDEIYSQLVQVRAYNVKMPDGALIQMMYRFSNSTLHSHRLAFFPSLHLEEFQNNPDIYLEEEVFADIVARNIVPFPLRFDYEANDQSAPASSHPLTHLTLGQYENCRIPVTAPMTPVRFTDFLLRSFYHTAYLKYADRLPSFSESFDESIRPAERNVVHVVTPP